jgi:hypothetical protein
LRLVISVLLVGSFQWQAVAVPTDLAENRTHPVRIKLELSIRYYLLGVITDSTSQALYDSSPSFFYQG